MDNSEKIKALLDESEKVAELQEELFNAKADMTLQVVGNLLEQMNSGIKELFEGMAATKHFDENLGEKIQASISLAITKLSEVKHEINFAPNITVDTKSLQPFLSENLNQSKLLYPLIEKLSKNDNDALARLITILVNKQIDFIEKFDNPDLLPGLFAINETLNKPKPTKWAGEVTERGEGGVLNKFVLEVVNNK